MVINGINNILLRDAVITKLSVGEQTISQEILSEGRREIWGHNKCECMTSLMVYWLKSFFMFVAILFLPN